MQSVGVVERGGVRQREYRDPGIAGGEQETLVGFGCLPVGTTHEFEAVAGAGDRPDHEECHLGRLGGGAGDVGPGAGPAGQMLPAFRPGGRTLLQDDEVGLG